MFFMKETLGTLEMEKKNNKDTQQQAFYMIISVIVASIRYRKKRKF